MKMKVFISGEAFFLRGGSFGRGRGSPRLGVGGLTASVDNGGGGVVLVDNQHEL